MCTNAFLHNVVARFVHSNFKLDNQNRIALLEIIEDRHNKGSIIITSQLPVKSWYEIIGEKTIADAILDRLIHQSHRIELGGESMRRKRKLINQKIV